MGADVLALQGATMIFTMLNRINSDPALYGLMEMTLLVNLVTVYESIYSP